MSSFKTAIIGAGMAGITAARSLITTGHDVQIFEKSRGSGGRLASKRSDMGRVNLGAQAFSTADPLFLDELNSWQQAGWVERCTTDSSYWTGTPYMSALTRNLLGDINTNFACEIRALSHNSNGWLLHDQQARTHGPFQYLIVAIPAPQAEILLANCAPELAEQAACVDMQPIWMVALGFKQPIALTNNLELLSNEAIAEVIHTPQSADHPMQTLMLRANKKWTKEHILDDRQHVIAALTESLAALLDHPLPTADSVFAHRWLYALGAMPIASTLLADAQRGLYIAGDWCGYGDVYSAWHSGDRKSVV